MDMQDTSLLTDLKVSLGYLQGAWSEIEGSLSKVGLDSLPVYLGIAFWFGVVSIGLICIRMVYLRNERNTHDYIGIVLRYVPRIVWFTGLSLVTSMYAFRLAGIRIATPIEFAMPDKYLQWLKWGVVACLGLASFWMIGSEVILNINKIRIEFRAWGKWANRDDYL